MSIQANLKEILSGIPKNVKLIAVSKFHSEQSIMEAYDCGQRIFGENKVQEMTQKHELLPKDIEWHFIGHLQKNKIKYIVPYVSYIHGVDSYELLKEINKLAAKANRSIPCLLQIHIAQEETKFGLSFEECRSILENEDWKLLENVSICGLMGMATNTDDNNLIKKEFSILHSFFEELKSKYFKNADFFKEISIGMSHDYQLAIHEGSTMVRIGSKIFGERTY